MNKKQFLCLILSLLMVLSVLAPATVFADDVEILDEASELEDTNTGMPDEVLNDEDEFSNENEASAPEEADNVNQDELLEEEKPAAEENNDAAAEGDAQNKDENLKAGETLDFEAGVVITSQPVNAKANVGDPVTFTVQANYVKTYEWQYKLSTGSTWRAMYSSAEGKNTATLKTEATDARYNYEYRCKLIGTNGETLYTNTVKIVKPAGKTEIVKQPVNAEANVGDPVTFAVEATGVATYEWQYKLSTGSTWRAMYSSAQGKNTATLTTEATDARYDYDYRCKLIGTNGETLYTDTVKIVKPASFVENNVRYYIIDSANVGVEKYLGSDTSVKIPNTVRNYTVTEIGEEAFMGNTTVKSVDLPDSITVIHARAFKDCTNLSEMK